MADKFITVPIVTDETQLYQIGVNRVRDTYPDWTPAKGSLVDLLFRTSASFAAIAAENASSVLPDIFRYFGALAQIQPFDAASAVATVRVTVQDNLGYTIPAQTPVGLKAGDTAPIGFVTQSDLIIPNGQTTGDVNVVAIEPGAAGNDLDTIERIDGLSYVTDISVTVPSSNGADAELTVDFIDRLSRELETWTTTPITEANFAVVAQKVQGVYRCAAWANLNPADSTTDNEKYVALCPIDVSGNALSGTIKAALAAFIESLREVNFVAPATDPDRVPVDVTYTAHVLPPLDAPTAEADIAGALGAFIDPSVWGMPTNQNRPIPIWNNIRWLYLNQVIQQIQNVPGVVRAVGVQIGNPVAAADYDMTAHLFPLPYIRTITPTIIVGD